MKKLWLWIEWALLFIVAPVVADLILRAGPWMLLLGCAAAMAAVWLWRCGDFSVKHFWRGENIEAEWRQLKNILLRFSISAVGLIALILALFPEKLFDLPRATPVRWAMLLMAYPVISVYPQELLYRAFFVQRYRSLFPRMEWLLLASALDFAWLHLIFRNHLAIILTLVGGWFFAETYVCTRSLRLVCLEHALYGNLIFTIGLGRYFLLDGLPRP
jgi:uncharacterized protein